MSSAFTAPLWLEIECFTLGSTSQAELEGAVDKLTSIVRGEEPGARGLYHAGGGVTKPGTSPMSQTGLTLWVFLNMPRFAACLQLLWMEMLRNGANSSLINNNNKSLQFLRIYYVLVIVF